MAATLPTADDIRAIVRDELRPVLDAMNRLREDQVSLPVSAAEYARRMGVSTRTVQRWIRSGEVKSILVGRTRRVVTPPEPPSTLPAGT